MMPRSFTLPVVALGTLAAGSSSGAIAYSGTLNSTVSSDAAQPDLYFDLSQESGTLAQNTSFAGADFQLHFQIPDGTVGSKPLITPLAPGAQISTDSKPLITTTLVSASGLASGASINSASDFSGSEQVLQSPGWAKDTPAFLALSIGSNYGWAQVTFTNDESGDIHSATLHDFAFANAGEQIVAGQTVIPEPSTYAAVTGLLAGSAALYARRRRRAA